MYDTQYMYTHDEAFVQYCQWRAAQLKEMAANCPTQFPFHSTRTTVGTLTCAPMSLSR